METTPTAAICDGSGSAAVTAAVGSRDRARYGSCPVCRITRPVTGVGQVTTHTRATARSADAAAAGGDTIVGMDAVELGQATVPNGGGTVVELLAEVAAFLDVVDTVAGDFRSELTGQTFDEIFDDNQPGRRGMQTNLRWIATQLHR